MAESSNQLTMVLRAKPYLPTWQWFCALSLRVNKRAVIERAFLGILIWSCYCSIGTVVVFASSQQQDILADQPGDISRLEPLNQVGQKRKHDAIADRHREDREHERSHGGAGHADGALRFDAHPISVLRASSATLGSAIPW